MEWGGIIQENLKHESDLSPILPAAAIWSAWSVLSKEEDMEEMAGGAGADLFPPVSSMKGAISSARLWFQTTPALQSTAVFGEHQRCSRATAWIRLAYTTVKELLGLQGFSLGYINLSILHLFSNKGFKDLPLFCAAYYFKVCTNHQQSIIFKTPKDPGMSIIQETKDNSYRINGSIWMCKAAEKINTQKMKV